MRHLVRSIPAICAVLVAAASFALSYVALRDVAVREFAVPADMAWLTPICVDGAVLAGSASLWASSHRRVRKDRVAILTVVVLLLVSVVINISHAGPSLLAKVIAALPPLTLLACLELVAGQYNKEESAGLGRSVPAQVTDAGESPVEAEPTGRPTEGHAAPVAPVAQVAQVVLAGAAGEDDATPAAAPVVESAPASRVVEPASPAPAPSHDLPTPRTGGPVTQPAAERDGVLSPDRDQPHAVEADIAAKRPEPTAAITTPTRTHSGRSLSAAAPAGSESGADGASITEQVADLFAKHLSDGGSATDASLARVFAGQLGASPAHVRRVLSPLRMAAQAGPGEH